MSFLDVCEVVVKYGECVSDEGACRFRQHVFLFVLIEDDGSLWVVDHVGGFQYLMAEF